MKTTAFILGILGVFSFASCRCNLEEDEPSDKRKIMCKPAVIRQDHRKMIH